MIWSYNCNNAMKKKITHLGTSIVRICQSILNEFPQQISNIESESPRITTYQVAEQEDLYKISVHVKKSQYDVQNCKSGRRNQRHTFKCPKSRYKPIFINILYNGLMVKERKGGNSKNPSSFRPNMILHSINYCQDSAVHQNTKLKSPFCISTNSTWATVTYQ